MNERRFITITHWRCYEGAALPARAPDHDVLRGESAEKLHETSTGSKRIRALASRVCLSATL